MERYFIVTEESSLRKDWFEYRKNRSRIRELVKEFNRENDIDSDAYYVTETSFFIVPTDKDKEKFGSVLGSPINDGLQKFKSNTKVGKAWVKAVKDAGLKVLHKPRLIFYLRHEGGKYRSRLFDINDVVYCSIDPCQDEMPKGFIEIKGSEFFKIIEEHENVTV